MVTDPSSASSSLPSTASASTSPSTGAAGDRSTSAHVSAGPIAGGIVAGVVALLVLIFIVLWWRRKSQRIASTSGSKTALDLNEDRNATVVEPFLPSINMSQSSTHITDQPTSTPTKLRTNPPTGASATHLNSLNASSSVPEPSSSASQPAYEAPPPSVRSNTAPRKHTRPRAESSGPLQESDAGVRLMGGIQREPATLPPAYDSSWRE
ncbi:transmembrane protein [Ceratobasidium sp. AG-Ba]|nr:transmembrane protein [Ceratobasidium sp. AG-Ba]